MSLSPPSLHAGPSVQWKERQGGQAVELADPTAWPSQSRGGTTGAASRRCSRAVVMATGLRVDPQGHLSASAQGTKEPPRSRVAEACVSAGEAQSQPGWWG